MAGGTAAIGLSVVWPQLIEAFSHGVPISGDGTLANEVAMCEVAGTGGFTTVCWQWHGLLEGKNQFKFMRAFYGLAVCFAIGIVSGLLTKGRPLDEIRGLVWGTVGDAIRMFYGGRRGADDESDWVLTAHTLTDSNAVDPNIHLPLIQISGGLAAKVDAQEGDILYLTDARWWLGGLRSGHARIGTVNETESGVNVTIGSNLHDRIVVRGRESCELKVKRLY